jgi:tRNA1Val (adenine37-N6)-methyltransferase
MPEQLFKFKEFEVKQDRCAMKVGTDGVLLGAWTDVEKASYILDVGTGTGLIALMLAQRSEAEIVAIDIDDDAFFQAKENVLNSKWNNRISVYHYSLQQLATFTKNNFDLIVSNPPYFSNSFKPTGDSRTIARHTEALNPKDFFKCCAALLKDDGLISTIFPAESFSIIKKAAEENGLYVVKECAVHPLPGKEPKRIMAEFSKTKPEEIIRKSLVIETGERHQYSEQYIELTKDFYLKM